MPNVLLRNSRFYQQRDIGVGVGSNKIKMMILIASKTCIHTLSILIVLLLHQCVVLTADGRLRKSGVEMIYPRHGEVLIGEDCGYFIAENVYACKFPIYIFGWFLPGTKYELPLLLNMIVDGVIHHPISLPNTMNDMFSITTYSYANLNISRTIAYKIQVLDANETLFFESMFAFMLAESRDIQESQFYSHWFSSEAKPVHMGGEAQNHYLDRILMTFLASLESVEQNVQRSAKAISEIDGHQTILADPETIEDESQPFLLDFIEVGTCDLDTILQTVHLHSQHLSQPNTHNTSAGMPSTLSRDHYRGISIEALHMYLNKLPDVTSVLKMHTAIMPIVAPFPIGIQSFDTLPRLQSNDQLTVQETLRRLQKQTREDPLAWVRIYHLPEYFVHQHFPDLIGVKEMSQINQVNERIAFILRNRSLSGSLIQKSFVPAISMTWLLSLLHTYQEHYMKNQSRKGINVMKLDIEGLDLMVVREVVAFYTLYLGLKETITSAWPCVFFFEYDITSAVEDILDRNHVAMQQRDNKHTAAAEIEPPNVANMDWKIQPNDIEYDLIIQLLQEIGYTFLHTDKRFFQHRFYTQNIFVKNLVAMNCQCSRRDLLDAWHLLDLWREKPMELSLLTSYCPNLLP